MKWSLLPVKHAIPYLKYILLPLLAAVYPAFFHYSNNARIVLLSSFGKMIALLAGIAAVVYILFCLIRRDNALQPANAALIFLLFFNTYGFLFNTLRAWDVVQVEHYILSPVFLMLGMYTAWFVSRVNERVSKSLWTGAVVILTILVIFNTVKIVPQEIRKNSTSSGSQNAAVTAAPQVARENSPDIYYIIFDEMAGFDAVRKYWQYEDIDLFVDFLESKGFYVAEDSHGLVPYTFYELAARLNYEIRPYDPSNPGKYQIEDFVAFAENNVMKFLKSYGYTTIAYDENRSAYAAPPVQVDYLFEKAADETMRGSGGLDDFGILVLENTILQPLVNKYKLDSPALEQHRNMVLFTMENVASENIQSPKMVYVHLLIPHIPFMFDANGYLVESQYHHDWDKYLGNYIFSLRVLEEMINTILATADPQNPPVIIIQSDHGARNLQISSSDVMLENYPEEYKTLIVNALYLPGCDDAPLTQDMNPINTFPIIFNCYFDAGIPLK